MCFSAIAELLKCPQACFCGVRRFVSKRHGLIDRAFPPWTWAVPLERPIFFPKTPKKPPPFVEHAAGTYAASGQLFTRGTPALHKMHLHFVRRSANFRNATLASLARTSQPSLGVSSLDLGRSFAGRPFFMGSAGLSPRIPRAFARRSWPDRYSAASGLSRSSGSSDARRPMTVSMSA